MATHAGRMTRPDATNKERQDIMTKVDATPIRELSNAEIQHAAGGAAYLKVDGIRGDVSKASQAGFAAGKVHYQDLRSN